MATATSSLALLQRKESWLRARGDSHRVASQLPAELRLRDRVPTGVLGVGEAQNSSRY
jgi:hypothetical protein